MEIARIIKVLAPRTERAEIRSFDAAVRQLEGEPPEAEAGSAYGGDGCLRAGLGKGHTGVVPRLPGGDEPDRRRERHNAACLRGLLPRSEEQVRRKQYQKHDYDGRAEDTQRPLSWSSRVVRAHALEHLIPYSLGLVSQGQWMSISFLGRPIRSAVISLSSSPPFQRWPPQPSQER